MKSELVKSYHISIHGKLEDGSECLLSEHYGGPVDDDALFRLAHRQRAAIIAAWPDWCPVQNPIVRMNWTHRQSMVLLP